MLLLLLFIFDMNMKQHQENLLVIILGQLTQPVNPAMSRLSAKVGKTNLRRGFTMSNMVVEFGKSKLHSGKVMPPIMNFVRKEG